MKGAYRREFYSITWSALTSNNGGMARPNVFAVRKLITVSNFVGCSIGRSAGFAPFSIPSKYPASPRCEYGPSRNHRCAMVHREIDDDFAVLNSEAVGEYRNRLWRLCRHRCKGARELVGGWSGKVLDGQAQPASHILGVSLLQMC